MGDNKRMNGRPSEGVVGGGGRQFMEPDNGEADCCWATGWREGKKDGEASSAREGTWVAESEIRDRRSERNGRGERAWPGEEDKDKVEEARGQRPRLTDGGRSGAWQGTGNVEAGGSRGGPEITDYLPPGCRTSKAPS